MTPKEMAEFLRNLEDADVNHPVGREKLNEVADFLESLGDKK